MKTYLPVIHSDAISGTGEPSNADAFVAAWLHLLGARANDMVQDSRLVAAAQKHATWLDANHIRENRHIGENGSTANQRTRAEGYRLPDWWPIIGNQVESVGECYDGPEMAVQLLVDSPLHREHMMRTGWWAKHPQPVFGVGNSYYFYVVVTAPIEGT